MNARRVARAGILLAACAAACGVRTPARIDVAALVAARGAVAARHELELRIVKRPGDVAARLALAELAEQAGRPGDAIEQLEAVVGLGGPLGTRWRAEDRARLARLTAARARARLTRGAHTALALLEHAGELGASIEPIALDRAQLVLALAELRHIDGKQRLAGQRRLLALRSSSIADPSWAGAGPAASVAERGRYGEWLWSVGARRAAWGELRAWHDATAAPRDPAIQAAFVAAHAWWSPVDAPPLDAAELIGPERCRLGPAIDGCAPSALLRREPRDEAAIAALLVAPPARSADPVEAAAWLAITLGQALRGELGWGAAFAARVELSALTTAALPAHARAAFAQLAGRTEPRPAGGLDGLAAPDRLVAAAGRALDGASPDQVRALLGAVAESDGGRALLRLVAPPAAEPVARPFVVAVVDHVHTRVTFGPPPAVIRRLVDAYERDPAIADRLAADAVAEAPDDAAAHAALGALFDALADPARARAAWQAAVAASPEPAFVRALAETLARAGDPDAALVVATGAAAASGDPAVVWTAVARALERAGDHVHALEAARSAIDLAGPDVIAAAYDVAIAASRALGRAAQADALAARRAAVAPPVTTPRDDDPTDAATALAAHRAGPSPATVARMWVASRWSPRDVAVRAALLAAISADDPRRHALVAELVALATDGDAELGRAAVAALRP